MKKPIKVIKRSAEPVEAEPVIVTNPQTHRQIERGLQDAVNGWIEERRRKGEIESVIAFARLRASRK